MRHAQKPVRWMWLMVQQELSDYVLAVGVTLDSSRARIKLGWKTEASVKDLRPEMVRADILHVTEKKHCHAD